MSEGSEGVRLIRRLLRAQEYRALAEREPEFDLFRLFDEVIVENSWSALLAYLFDSERDHGLGHRPFRSWLRHVAVESGDSRLQDFIRRLPAPATSTNRARYQWRTQGGRLLDVLIEVLGPRGDVRGVVGIEVKVDAGEQREQLRDYQAALDRTFLRVPKCVVFLSPTGREARTASTQRRCPCVPCSYATVASVCAAVRTRATGSVRLLLSALSRRMADLASEENGMKRDVQKLVNRLLKDDGHRKAIRLLAEFAPSLRLICERVRDSIEHEVESLPQASRPESYPRLETYPQSAQNPREIKVQFRELDDLSNGFWFVYMLHSPDDTPGPGSCFSLCLVAWCDTLTARKRVRRLRDAVKLPPDRGAPRQWHNWESVWTGESYRLVDLGPKDIKGLSSLCVSGIRKTYGTLRTVLRRKR